jgi:cytochrome b
MAGYVVTSLLVFRVVWGFIGTRHARFADFVRTPDAVVAYLKSLLRPNAPRYLGHNPAGGAMIVALLILLALTSLSGLVVYAIGDQAGPLARLFAGVSSRWEDIVGELHELLANTTLLLVAVHVGGVAIESIRHRENLVRAMWTGSKRISDQRR